MLTAENLVGTDPHTAVADALFIREVVSLTGDYTCTLYEKIGTVSVETPALGTITVNPDCSFTSTLEVPEFFSGAIVIKGVFFNGGKEYYALAIDEGVPYSFVQGNRISQ